MSEAFEQSIEIKASATTVENCVTDLALMQRWLNPLLKCEPVGKWSTEVGSRSRFIVQFPLWQPTLNNIVKERNPGLIVWEFKGFFQGCDTWECQPLSSGTLLVNRFEFTIPNPLIAWGFNQFAAPWTKKDMKAQLQRIKQLAERLELKQV
jgi:hypothetical protein